MSENAETEKRFTKKVTVNVPPSVSTEVRAYFDFLSELREERGDRMSSGDKRSYNHGLRPMLCWLMRLSEDDLWRIYEEGEAIIPEILAQEDRDREAGRRSPWRRNTESVLLPKLAGDTVVVAGTRLGSSGSLPADRDEDVSRVKGARVRKAKD